MQHLQDAVGLSHSWKLSFYIRAVLASSSPAWDWIEFGSGSEASKPTSTILNPAWNQLGQLQIPCAVSFMCGVQMLEKHCCLDSAFDWKAQDAARLVWLLAALFVGLFLVGAHYRVRKEELTDEYF